MSPIRPAATLHEYMMSSTPVLRNDVTVVQPLGRGNSQRSCICPATSTYSDLDSHGHDHKSSFAAPSFMKAVLHCGVCIHQHKATSHTDTPSPPSREIALSSDDMSGRYPVYGQVDPDEDIDWEQWQLQITTLPVQQQIPAYANSAFTTAALDPSILTQSQSFYQYPQGYAPLNQQRRTSQTWPVAYPQTIQRVPTHQLQQQQQQQQQPPWAPHILPSNSPWPSSSNFNAQAYPYVPQQALPATSPALSRAHLSPESSSRGTRPSRSTSLASDVSSTYSVSDRSQTEPPSVAEMSKYGFRNPDGSWTCAYPGCTSRTTFTRGCDIRKHYKRHTKTLFCRVDGCPQAVEGGFSSRKDRARHEAKHNPNVACEWEGCDRVFSRVDNMKDHVRRVHRRRAAS